MPGDFRPFAGPLDDRRYIATAGGKSNRMRRSGAWHPSPQGLIRRRPARERAEPLGRHPERRIKAARHILKGDQGGELDHRIDLRRRDDALRPAERRPDVRAFLASSRHERFGLPFTDLVYLPMLELLDYLRAHGWRVYICSGGGRDFMRVFSEETFGIPRENVIGSAPEWGYEDGRLVRRNELHGDLALGPGKPEHIYARTGRLPMFAAGNGDVDIEMLEVADFALVLVHDDDEREVSYAAGAEHLLGVAADRGWTTARIKEDWITVF